ncbi:PREDICTED: uncharacterized protein LOC109591194 [Amphimedon queenslandica]|uniref:Uncharacterized protein n=3 Tax=Amphimedon queenslandica TaxID=400682 RepID=A0AAN0K040_AMPQE|nr:PREDICTED: uncharacterized protein LOC109591194 [Amphimedon queenslandica]|eukprot:XP_019862533.1 PREDICTED: uncharacterized protein LOC109591194 [Amphimedon queenslandica]
MNITGSVLVPLHEQCSISIVFSNEAGSSEPFLELFNTTASIFPTIATETPSSTRGTINDTSHYIIPVVVSTISVCIALVLVIILTVCAVIIVTKKRTKQVYSLSIDMANTEKLQVEANQYQDFHELMNITSAVTLTNNRPIDDESPYHVGITEFLPRETIPSNIVEESMQKQRSETQEDSISSTASNKIHDPDDLAVTVNTNDDTTHTEAVIAKRTDAPTTHNNPPTAVKPKAIGNVNARKGHAKFTSKDEQFKVEASERSEEEMEREEQALVTKQ